MISALTVIVLSVDDMPQCTMCSSRTAELCTGCNSTRYCSKTCMKADLPVHKLLCGVSKPEPSYDSYCNSQPEHPCFQGVLYPAIGCKPSWVIYRGNYPRRYIDECGNYYRDSPHPATQLLRHLGSPWIITGNALRSRTRTLDKLELYATTTTNRPTTEYPLNLSVLSVTNQRPAQNWCGPLLVVKVSLKEMPRYTAPQYQDIDMVDFRDITDFLCTYPTININDMTSSIAAAVSTPKLEVSAIRINCPGDQALGRPNFERVTLRLDDPACRAPVTAISQRIEFPVRVSQCRPPHATQFDASSHGVINLAATDLNMGVDPTKDWGFVGPEWLDPAGSVFVVRDDGKPLHPQHVEALCHWCLYVLRPLFADSMGMGADPLDPMDRERVLARVDKREWQCFYRGFDEWKGANRQVWTKGMWPC